MRPEARVLALDTTTHAASAAVLENGRVIGLVGLHTRRPSRTLLPALENLLRCLDLRVGDMDAFAVTAGPGSFTGLRVGMVAAQTMARAAGRPVMGVETLEALAATARHQQPPICVMLDARRGRVYAATFALVDGWPVRTAPIEDARPAEYLRRLPWPATLVGDGLEAHPEAVSAAPPGSRSAEIQPFLAPLVGILAARGRAVAAAPGALRPLYVRAADARLPSAETPRPDDG